MGRRQSATVEAETPERARTAETDIPVWGEVVAVVIERADTTCVLLYPGFGSSRTSLGAAMDAVENVTPGVVWREKSTGSWIARAR